MNPQRIEAWACGNCKMTHDTERDAEECCHCAECKTPFAAKVYGEQLCEHCVHERRIHDSKARIRHARKGLSIEEGQLAALKAMPTPAKGFVQPFDDDDAEGTVTP